MGDVKVEEDGGKGKDGGKEKEKVKAKGKDKVGEVSRYNDFFFSALLKLQVQFVISHTGHFIIPPLI